MLPACAGGVTISQPVRPGKARAAIAPSAPIVNSPLTRSPEPQERGGLQGSTGVTGSGDVRSALRAEMLVKHLKEIADPIRFREDFDGTVIEHVLGTTSTHFTGYYDDRDVLGDGFSL